MTPATYDALGGKRGRTKQGIAWGEIIVMIEAVDD